MAESYAKAPDKLDESRKWFVPGFCYSFAKLPVSIFSVIKADSAADAEVVTLMSPKPLYVTNGFPLPPDNWRGTLQGITVSRAMRFLMELEAAVFNTRAGTWRFTVHTVLSSDPFSPLHAVPILFLLPRCDQYRLTVTKVLDDGAVVVEKRHDRRR